MNQAWYFRNRSDCRGVWSFMTEMIFDPPVGIYFGKMGQARAVGSVQEAAECLINERWPSHSGEAFEGALLTLIAASEGRKNTAQAREAFAEAAREAGILVERKLMLH
jgi:hypothetical protein